MIGTLIVAIAFALIRYLIYDKDVKWSEEAKTVVMGICALQYLKQNNHPTTWSLSEIENNDKMGFKKITNCSSTFESKYEPQEFFDNWKSNTAIVTNEARTYLH